MTEPSDAELIDLIQFAEAKKAKADSMAKKLKHQLFLRKEAQINSLYKEKPEPYGDIAIEISGKKIKATLPKKVSWDQSILKSLAAQIVADGAEVSDFIDTEYSVQEKRWSSWGDNIRSHFIAARTVTPGNISIKILEEKE